MLKKSEVKSYKELVSLDDRYISATMILNLIETLESAMEVFKRLKASDTLGREGREFLAKYERED
jgi:hypothetical protein